VANDDRELRAIRLRFYIRALSFFFIKLKSLSYGVRYAIEVYLNDVFILRFRQIHDEGKGFRKGLILESYKGYFL
jgi:hypothetical protein